MRVDWLTQWMNQRNIDDVISAIVDDDYNKRFYITKDPILRR